MPALRLCAALALLPIVACQEPSAQGQPDPAAGPATREENWAVCKDPNRGPFAVRACTALIETGQETPQALAYVYYNRGLALTRRSQSRAAIADFDAALRLEPLFAFALYQRGLALREQGQVIRAEMDLQRARQLNPRLP